MKTVVFITTGQPTTNPRLVKEAKTLHEQGFHVKVICCFYQAWAQEFDAAITDLYPGMFIYCGGSPTGNKGLYYKTLIRQKLSRAMFRYSKNFGIPENAINRTHTEALRIAKKIKADIYIAHNLGALPAAVLAAKHNKAKVGYDAEDMNSGQYTSVTDDGYRLNKYVEEKYFSNTNYFSAASPLIAENYKRLYPFLQPVVINNVFPRVNLSFEKKIGSVLRLVWFSQTIGANRGLEAIIEAVGVCGNRLQLHFIGKISDSDRALFFDLANKVGLADEQLQIHPPIAPEKLPTFISDFDIGVASEPSYNLNNDIALSNKLFTYVQCGLAVIASNTSAQEGFLNEYPNVGKLYIKNDHLSAAQALTYYIENDQALRQTRLHNYKLGQTKLNWEHESDTFINLVNKTLS